MKKKPRLTHAQRLSYAVNVDCAQLTYTNRSQETWFCHLVWLLFQRFRQYLALSRGIEIAPALIEAIFPLCMRRTMNCANSSDALKEFHENISSHRRTTIRPMSYRQPVPLPEFEFTQLVIPFHSVWLYRFQSLQTKEIGNHMVRGLRALTKIECIKINLSHANKQIHAKLNRKKKNVYTKTKRKQQQREEKLEYAGPRGRKVKFICFDETNEFDFDSVSWIVCLSARGEKIRFAFTWMDATKRTSKHQKHLLFPSICRSLFDF